MNTRRQQRVNYRQLHEGKQLNQTIKSKPSWSKTKFWKFTVLEERGEEVKVHWEGWSSKWDQYGYRKRR